MSASTGMAGGQTLEKEHKTGDLINFQVVDKSGKARGRLATGCVRSVKSGGTLLVETLIGDDVEVTPECVVQSAAPDITESRGVINASPHRWTKEDGVPLEKGSWYPDDCEHYSQDSGRGGRSFKCAGEIMDAENNAGFACGVSDSRLASHGRKVRPPALRTIWIAYHLPALHATFRTPPPSNLVRCC
jgi:hypothetical protein